ncbi:hypothetical protein [Nissabacter sp. SGAir0207]|uniref:hypothetical protein n=1 Tax=Nissabacter sp. SGAir0207 TaxID=2126321 RepID=UPI0010CCC31D|nr:hypothetical protein [Nissabacter sp. SGAir0207]QCR38727.1 hypothetical protein C1N62_21565 [Nissabacter sp. SGAir0207]
MIARFTAEGALQLKEAAKITSNGDIEGAAWNNGLLSDYLSTVINGAITGIRMGESVFIHLSGRLREMYDGHVITAGGDFGADDGSYYSRPLQYYVNGTWYTATYVNGLTTYPS